MIPLKISTRIQDLWPKEHYFVSTISYAQSFFFSIIHISAVFFCIDANIQHIGYGIMCFRFGVPEVQWQALDNPNDLWPPWEYFPANAPTGTTEFVPFKFIQQNGL